MYYLDNDELCPTRQFAFDGAMSILNLLNFVSRKQMFLKDSRRYEKVIAQIKRSILRACYLADEGDYSYGRLRPA